MPTYQVIFIAVELFLYGVICNDHAIIFLDLPDEELYVVPERAAVKKVVSE